MGVCFGGVCADLRVSEVESEDAWWSTSAEACLLQVVLVVAFLRLGL